MIITLTLNPAIDRTVRVDALDVGKVNRSNNGILEIGGKGINVSRAIKAVGGESVVMGFCGGANGKFIKNKLTSVDIHYDFIDVPGDVRTNIKIIDTKGVHTDINESGFTVTDSDFLRLLDRIELYLDEKNIFVLSGRPPANFPLKNYKRLCKKITKSGSVLIVDADGERLEAALESKPFFVKPNAAEAEGITGICVKDPESALAAAKVIAEKGAQYVCVSMGEHGAIFYTEKEKPLYIKSGHVEAKGPVGAGDALVGGFVNAYAAGSSFEECAKSAVATATASTAYEGTTMPTLKQVFLVYENLKVYTCS